MAAMMTWADPSMAWATGLAGSLSWLAIRLHSRDLLHADPALLTRIGLMRCSGHGRLSDRDIGDLGRGQARHDGIGDGRRGSPGEVMTRALDELQASVRQGPGQPAGGVEGNHLVLGIGEHENRRLNRRDSVLQLVELVQQGALLGQEGTP